MQRSVSRLLQFTFLITEIFNALEFIALKIPQNLNLIFVKLHFNLFNDKYSRVAFLVGMIALKNRTPLTFYKDKYQSAKATLRFFSGIDFFWLRLFAKLFDRRCVQPKSKCFNNLHDS